MPSVTIRLLGGFTALVDGEPVGERGWRLRKARELVKLLALAPGHRLHREQAMDVLWPDRDLASAGNNLNQALHVARRALGPEAISLRDEVLTLAAEVDVDELERAAAAARRAATPAAYRAALDVYGGELLPENRYDDWASARRRELAALHDELSAELAALGGAAAILPRSLPAEASSFVGRGRELAELRALVARTRLLTLTGPGGAGKTRLALELARANEHSYAGGVALVELASVQAAALVPVAVAAALDVRALPGRSLGDSVVDFLAPRSLLLVVDNCEHVLGATAALVDALLRGAPGLTVLATSREPLRVAGEVVFRVPSLAIPAPRQGLGPDELLRYEGVRLFVERAAAASPGFELDETTAGDVARICFRLDGLPLALELAAGRLGALSVAAVAARLDDRFRLLRTGSHAAPTRQQTLAATLQWSYDLLDPAEALLLQRLSVFAGGFELEAAEDVCGDREIDGADVADLLARLVEKSLVAVDDREGDRRYRLLETIRADAGARLAAAGATAALAERHARWALGRASLEADSTRLDREEANLRLALDTLLASDPDEALRLCTALWPFWLRRIDLQEAQGRFEAALAGSPAATPLRASALLAAATIDLRAGSLARAAERAQESLDTATGLGDARATWRALQFLGGAGVANDDIEDARRWLEAAIELARRERFAPGEAIGTYALGVVHWLADEPAAADELIAESLATFRELVDSPERIPSPVNIAEVRTVGAAGGTALGSVFEETLQPFVEISCGEAVGYVLANRANLARFSGDLERARALLDESAARFDRTGDDRGQADVLVRRAYLELASGSPPEAERCFRRALALRRGLNDRRGIGLVLAGLGGIATSSGDYRAAEEHLAESRDIFRRAGDRWGLVAALWRTADLAFARDRLDEAETALEDARRVVGVTRRSRWIAFTLYGLAEVAARRGDLERARALLADARDLLAEAGDVAGTDSASERLAELAKPALRARKARPATPSRTTTARRRNA